MTADGPGEPETRQAAEEQGASPKLSVLVGSDDPFTRQALRVGASSPDIEVLADGTVTAIAEHLAAQLEPDIVMLDVQTAAAYALRAIQRIRLGAASAKILACSAPAGTEFGMLCLSAGAWGYVSKEIDLAVLPDVLRALGRGEAVIPQALATELVRRFAETNAPDQPTSAELSAPECRLLDLLRTGSTLSEAASEIGITLATARRHLGSARRKVAVPPPA
jgi:DNA-binding NarL/FixJ family response regulator